MATDAGHDHRRAARRAAAPGRGSAIITSRRSRARSGRRRRAASSISRRRRWCGSSATTRLLGLPRAAPVVHGAGRLGRICRAPAAPRLIAGASTSAWRAASRRCAGRAGRRGAAARRRMGRLRRGRLRHPFRHDAARCCPTPTPERSARRCRRSATSRTRRSCMPTPSLMPKRRAALGRRGTTAEDGAARGPTGST